MNRKLTVQKTVELASRCKTRIEFQHRYQPAYNKALRLDMMDELFGPKKKRTNRGGGKRYWTYERLLKTARRYKTRMSFRMKQPSAYMSAYGYNVLEEICAHMPKRIPYVKKRPNIELLKAAASECKTQKDFKDRYSGGHWNAMRFGLLQELFPGERRGRKRKGE